MRKLKMGIVGLGRGADAASWIQRLSRKISIEAVCDLNNERLAGASRVVPGAKTFNSLEEMLENADIEAVYAATPIPSHAEHCRRILSAGKHVISEVTALTDLRDCESLSRAVRESGKKYMMAENYCWLRSWNIALGMVKAGLFGEIFYAESNYLMDFTDRPGYPYIGGWRQNVYHMHRGHVYITHSLGPLTMLFKEPLRKVSCVGSGQHPRSWGLRADNTCCLNLKTESGKLIHLRQDFLSPRPHDFLYYGFQGTKGAYEGTHSLHGAFDPKIQEGDHRVYVEGVCKKGEWKNLEDFSEYLPDEWKAVPPELVDNSYNGGTAMMFDAFAQSIFDNTETPIPLDVALNWTAAGILSEQSADLDGAPVEIPDFH